jgi:hypothetical protein
LKILTEMDSFCRDLSISVKFEMKKLKTKKFQKSFHFFVFAVQRSTRPIRITEIQIWRQSSFSRQINNMRDNGYSQEIKSNILEI